MLDILTLLLPHGDGILIDLNTDTVSDKRGFRCQRFQGRSGVTMRRDREELGESNRAEDVAFLHTRGRVTHNQSSSTNKQAAKLYFFDGQTCTMIQAECLRST